MNIRNFVKAGAAACALLMHGVLFTSAQAAQSDLAKSLDGHPMWGQYKTRFITAEGAVVDNVNKGISHSESQGYGMMLALIANDPETFERIYRFAAQKLRIRSDALFAWKFDPTKSSPVSDSNNASDGDLLIAWALLEATEAGWNPQYRVFAMDILAALESQVKSYPNIGLVLAPGEKGFTKENGVQVINPSYWIFPALERISHLTGNRKWLRLSSTGEQIVDQFLAKPDRLVPDWAVITSNSTNAGFDEKLSSDFGYEAIRIPLYLMMGSRTDKDLAYTLVDRAIEASSLKLQRINAITGKRVGLFSDIGYAAIVDLAGCMREGRAFRNSVATTLDRNYYPATLQLFAIATASLGKNKCI